MEVSLPDEVRAALTDAGLSLDEVQGKTGDELREAVGDRLTYELIVALAGQRRTVARWSGKPGKLPPDDLIERNLDVLRLRLIDGLNFAAIGREVGLTGGRVSGILRTYYGVDGKPRPIAMVLAIPAASLPVVREALRMHLLSVVEDLHTCLTTGEPDLSDELRRFDDTRSMLREVVGRVDIEMYVGRGRGSLLTDALRHQLDTERHLADTPARNQRMVAEANAAIIERLLGDL